MKAQYLIGVLAACACLVLPARGAEKDTLNAYDVKFVKSAAQSSLNEVKLAELGGQKALNPDLKALAGTLVRDHNTMLSEAKALADKKGITVSASIDADAAEAFKALETKTGAEFDKAFTKHMDEGHIKSIKSYEEAQKEAKDRDLKAWIDKAVVVIKRHHEAIKKLK